MLGMQRKADQWLSQPNLTEETIKVALTGHSVRNMMLKKLHNSLIFSKIQQETVKRGHGHSACKLLVEGTVHDSTRKLLVKNL
jgi:hypothetical protein